MAIADVFDALTSERSYKPAFEVDHAVAIMTEERDSHFDPALLDIFLTLVDEVVGLAVRHLGQGPQHLSARSRSPTGAVCWLTFAGLHCPSRKVEERIASPRVAQGHRHGCADRALESLPPASPSCSRGDKGL